MLTAQLLYYVTLGEKCKFFFSQPSQVVDLRGFSGLLPFFPLPDLGLWEGEAPLLLGVGGALTFSSSSETSD